MQKYSKCIRAFLLHLEQKLNIFLGKREVMLDISMDILLKTVYFGLLDIFFCSVWNRKTCSKTCCKLLLNERKGNTDNAFPFSIRNWYFRNDNYLQHRTWQLVFWCGIQQTMRSFNFNPKQVAQFVNRHLEW